MYCDFPVVGRCCFCMPLRRGILTLGYINILTSLFMIAAFSYALSIADPGIVYYHGARASLPAALCITMQCIDLIFNGILVYGAHKALMRLIKVYYYFSISTIVASVLIQVIEIIITITDEGPYVMPAGQRVLFMLEEMPLLIVSLIIQVYLIILIRSLLWKLERTGPSMYENPLQQIVYNGRVDDKGVYETTVEAVDV